MTRVVVGFKLKMTSFDPQAVIDHVANRGAKGLNTTVLPHLLEVAKAKAPVGRERNFNPQRGSKSFQKIGLREPFGEGERFSAEERSRLRDLRLLTARELAGEVRSGDIKFFQGTGKNAGRTPDLIETTRGGFLRGAFAHRSGTLRDSHVIVPAKREGMLVVGKVRATADYAKAIHDGFTHKGGQKKTGRTTRIKGRKWLKESLVNVRDDLANPSTYEG